jgi:hypothetical protein
VVVEVGLSDNANTEIQGENLSEGMDVVIGEAAPNGGTAQTTNPFTPQLFGNRRPQQ